MQLTETARVRLLIDGKEAVSELSIMENKYQQLLDKQKEFKKSSKEWRDIEREIKETAKTVDVLRERVDLSQMTFKELNRYAKDLASTMRNDLVQGTEEYNRASAKLTDVNTRIKDIRGDLRATHDEVAKGETTWGKMKNWVMGAFAVAAILEFGRRVVDFGKEVFELTAKFEGYNTVLKNMLGGQAEANAAMEMIKETAATTNWSVDELTDSLIKLVGRGLKPMPKDITAISDVSNFLKKDFGQLVEAINDINNTERWNEIGIKAKTSGDKVSLTFRGVTETVDRTEAGVLSAVTAFGQMEGVMGVTAAMSGTLGGKLSNLGDAWDFVQLKLGDKLMPIFERLLELFADGVEFVSEFIDRSGVLSPVFTAIGDAFGIVFNIGRDLFYSLFPSASKNTDILGIFLEGLAKVLLIVANTIKIVVSAVQILIDAFLVIGKAVEVADLALQGNFEGAKKAATETGKAWDTLKGNATKNFGSIAQSFNSMWTGTEAAAKKAGDAVDIYGKVADQVQTGMTDTQKKEADKRLKIEEKALAEQLKVTAEAIAKIDAAWIESHDDEVERNKLKLMAKYEAELEAFEKKKVSAEQYAELEKQLKENLVRDLEKIDADSLEKQTAARAKYSAAMQKDIEKIQDNIPALHERAAVKVADIEKRLGDQIIAFHKNVEAKKDAAFQKEVEQQALREQLMQQGFQVVGLILNEIEGNIDKQLALATTATERAVLENKKAWLSVADSAMNAVGQFASGNVVGGIVSGLGALFGALNNWVNKSANLMQARLEDLRRELEAAGKAFLEFANGFSDAIDPTKIEAAYEGLFKISQIQPVRLDLGEYDSYERRIEQEIEIANSINQNYDTAIKREDEYSKGVIDNIETAWDAEVKRINDKYDLLDQLANQQFTVETLKIKEAQGQQLLELIDNEAEKTAVLEEYALKRNEIVTAFALADKVITEETDQATIDAINAARDARTEALIDVQDKLNKELEAMVNTEGNKRKELTETEAIAKTAEESIDKLKIEKQAADISRSRDKNIELVTAEQNKNNLLEAEAARYNDELTRLGQERDFKLAESFTMLKDLMAAGYDDIMAKALAAYNAGKITSDQYNEIASKLYNIQNLINTTDWSKVTVPSFDWNFTVPKFENGTFQPLRDTTYFEGAGTLGGLRHATPEGGNWVINPRNGKLLATVENGEFMGVFSREVTRQHGALLSKLANSSLARSGTPIVAEKGFFGKSFESGRMNTAGSGDGLSAELLQENNRLLAELSMIMLNVAESSDKAAKKQLVLSVNRLQDASNSVYEIDRRSEFR